MSTIGHPAHPHPTPCNFLEFLEQERRLDEAAIAEQLGQWLLDYEPGPVALSHGAQPLRELRRASRVDAAARQSSCAA